MGRVFQYLEERGFSGCIPDKGRHPASLSVWVPGQEYKPGAGVGHAGGWGGPQGLQGTDAGLLLLHHPAKYL